MDSYIETFFAETAPQKPVVSMAIKPVIKFRKSSMSEYKTA
jgi:hypothetical protein